MFWAWYGFSLAVLWLVVTAMSVTSLRDPLGYQSFWRVWLSPLRSGLLGLSLLSSFCYDSMWGFCLLLLWVLAVWGGSFGRDRWSGYAAFPGEWVAALPYVVPSVLLLSVFLMFYGIETVETASDLPYFRPGDTVLLARWPYGVYAWPVKRWLWQWSSIKRGDVVMVAGVDSSWAGRVIALPGEHLRYANRRLEIDGRQVRSRERMWRWGDPLISVHEELGGVVYPVWYMAHAHRIGSVDRHLQHDTFYLLADRRDVAWDSRLEGVVQMDAVLGRVEGTVWKPWSKIYG